MPATYSIPEIVLTGPVIGFSIDRKLIRRTYTAEGLTEFTMVSFWETSSLHFG